MKSLSTSEAQEGEEVVAIIPVEDLALMDALEERIDLEEARSALREAEEEGTIPLDVLKRELGF